MLVNRINKGLFSAPCLLLPPQAAAPQLAMLTMQAALAALAMQAGSPPPPGDL